MNIKAALPVAIVGIATFAALYFLTRKRKSATIAPENFVGPLLVKDDTWYI